MVFAASLYFHGDAAVMFFSGASSRRQSLIAIYGLVAERKPSFSPISVSGSNFNPQNTLSIPAVKIVAFLELSEKPWFSFGHWISLLMREEPASKVFRRSGVRCVLSPKGNPQFPRPFAGSVFHRFPRDRSRFSCPRGCR